MFSRPTLVAHAVHLNDDEIALLAERGVAVSHNPASNLKLASGVARVPDMLRAGVTVSLGTDSAASNNNLDLFDEIPAGGAHSQGRLRRSDGGPGLGSAQAGTVYGARRSGSRTDREAKPGMKADFIAFDVDQPHYHPRTEIVSHLVYAGSAETCYTSGSTACKSSRNRTCTRLDEERIAAEAAARFERLSSAT